MHQPNHWSDPRGRGLGAHSAIRVGNWKLIHYYDPERPEPVELFHLTADLGEQRNLAATEPERRDALARRLGSALARMNAQVPLDHETGRPVALPGAR